MDGVRVCHPSQPLPRPRISIAKQRANPNQVESQSDQKHWAGDKNCDPQMVSPQQHDQYGHKVESDTEMEAARLEHAHDIRGILSQRALRSQQQIPVRWAKDGRPESSYKKEPDADTSKRIDWQKSKRPAQGGTSDSTECTQKSERYSNKNMHINSVTSLARAASRGAPSCMSGTWSRAQRGRLRPMAHEREVFDSSSTCTRNIGAQQGRSPTL